MILYGAGSIGKLAGIYYKNESIKYYVDSFKEGKIFNYDIKKLEHLKDERKDEKIVICSCAWKEIAEELNILGFKNKWIFKVMTNLNRTRLKQYVVHGTDSKTEQILDYYCKEANLSKVDEWTDNSILVNIGSAVLENVHYTINKYHGFFKIVVEKYEDLMKSEKMVNRRTKLYFGSGGINNPVYYVFDNESEDCLVQSIKGDNDVCSEINSILDFLKIEKGTLLDLGANIGAFSLTFASEGYNVIAVEAGHHNCECLRLASKKNNFNIEVLEKAIWNSSGELYFFEDGVNGSVTNENIGERIECICLDELDRYVENIKEISIIKLDVEGAEIKALQGGKKFLEKYNFPPVYCESNKVTLYRSDNNVHDLFEEFFSIGYKPYILVDGSLKIVDSEEIQPRTVQDYMFVYKEDKRVSKDKLLESMGKDEIVKLIKNEIQTMPADYVKATLKSLEEYPVLKKLIEG